MEKLEIKKSGQDNRIEKEYRQAVETLTSRRLKLSGWLLGAWVVPMGLLYVMGSLVGWIRQGRS